jgi:hypothetical protein
MSGASQARILYATLKECLWVASRSLTAFSALKSGVENERARRNLSSLG